MDISDNIRHYRESRRMSREQLGDLIEKSQHTIKKYELGEVSPTLGVIESIAIALEVGVVDLLGLAKEDTPLHSFSDVVFNTSDEMANDIRETRLRLNLTMEEFGKLFNPPASKSIVSRWERGVSSPNIERRKDFNDIKNGVIKDKLDCFSDVELIDELKRRAMNRGAENGN